MRTRPLFLVFFFIASGLNAAPLDPLVKSLAKGASELKTKKIAVLAFPYHDGGMSSGSTIVSERITTQMVGKKGIQVIERRLIEQLLTEKKLSETGVVSQEDLNDIGKVLDADAVVTGTLIDLSNGRTEINARLIRTDSGEVLSAAQETIERTWRDPPLLPKKKFVEKTSPKPVVREPEPVEQLMEQEAALPMSPAPASNKRLMRLSNESFPEGRRIYHSNKPGGPKKKPKYRYEHEDDREGRDDRYEQAYDEGYVDAYRESLSQKRPPSNSSSVEPQPEERRIEHPTEIGVVRTERPRPASPASRKRSSY